MENIKTSLVIDVSFMTCLYYRECDTNVCPVAGREGASEAAAAVHLFAKEEKNSTSKKQNKTNKMYSNNLKIQFSQDLEVYINNNTNNLHRIQGDHFRFFFYRCLYKWLLRLGEIKYL